MDAGMQSATNSGQKKPGRKIVVLFGGAAIAVIAGGLLMQYFRASDGRAADGPAGTARVGGGNSERPKTMARVGKESISYDVLAMECVNRFGKEVLDDLINRLTIQQACEQAGVTVTDAEVSQEIARQAERFRMDVAQYLTMLEQERNISPMQFRMSVVWPKLALQKLAGQAVEVEEDEISKAFVRNYGPRAKVRVIILDNQRRANEVWTEVSRDPENFEEMAQKHSVDPNSRALGGQVPPVPRYSGMDELEKEAFKLKPGQISGLVELPNRRWAVMKGEGRTEPVVKDIEEVRDSLYDEIKESKVQQAVGKKFEEIRSKTPVDNYLAMTVSGPKRQPAAGGDVQPASGTGPARQSAAGPTRPTTVGAPAKAARN